MKKRIFYIFLLFAIIPTIAIAQEDRNSLPDLQTANADFFDPTRKDKPEQVYKFSAPWRFEVGYAQLNHRTQDTSAIYLHGLRIGATVDFVLPYNFSLQTGALATFTYGRNNQHWPSMTEESAQYNIMQHDVLQLQLSIPVRAYYNITLWKQLRMFFYAGPQLQIGLTNYDRIVDKNGYFFGSTFDENGQLINSPVAPNVVDWLKDNHLVPTVKDENGEDKIINQDQYVAHHLYRTNIQFGLGGGIEWDRYRLQAGYDFGLNNILRTPILPKQKMHEWGWMCTFSYQL